MFRLGRSTLEVKRKLEAYDCGSGGRWFESTQLYQAEITQETASHDSLFLALILRRVGTGSALAAKSGLSSRATWPLPAGCPPPGHHRVDLGIERTAALAPHPRRLAPLRNGLCGVVALEKCGRIALRRACIGPAVHSAAAVRHLAC